MTEGKDKLKHLKSPGVLGPWHLLIPLSWYGHTVPALGDCSSPTPSSPTESENLGIGQEPVTLRELSCDQLGLVATQVNPSPFSIPQPQAYPVPKELLQYLLISPTSQTATVLDEWHISQSTSAQALGTVNLIPYFQSVLPLIFPKTHCDVHL